MEPASDRSSLREVAGLFLKLGVIGFGGPAAHIAMMRNEVVTRRRWLTEAEFLDLVGATNLIPGPNSTELAIHLGHRRAGWRGLLVAGAAFIVPAVVIVGVIAALYRRYGTEPAAFDLRYGILPVIVAVIAQALWGLLRTAATTVVTGAVAVGAAVGWWFGVDEVVLLLAGAAVTSGWAERDRLRRRLRDGPLALLLVVPGGAEVDNWRLFLAFLRVGALLYGSGYVLVSFLEQDLVRELGWLTETQLLDAVAVGQVTPGPLFSTATFVGYQLGGVVGAVVATVAIFAPAFVFVAALAPLVRVIRRSPRSGAALDGVNAVAVGLMAAVALRLADAAFVDPLTVGLGAAALGALLRFRLNSAWLVGAGAIVGLLHGLLL